MYSRMEVGIWLISQEFYLKEFTHSTVRIQLMNKFNKCNFKIQIKLSIKAI